MIKFFTTWTVSTLLVWIIIIFAGGGLDFLSQPIGVIYLILWATWILVMVVFRNVGEQPSPGRRPPSFIMTTGMLLLLILPPWEYAHFPGFLRRDGISAWTGLLIFAFGIFLQYAAMRTLKRNYGAGQMLVTSGPYGIVRHPGTIGHLLTMAGIGFSLSSIAALALTILFVPLLIIQIKDEEEALIAKFGNDYRNYTQKTKWRLIPLVY